MGGGQGAIAAQRSGDGLGSGRHTWIEGLLENAGQRIGRWCDRRMRGSKPEVMDSLGPVVLVVDLRDNDLRHARKRGGGGGPRAAMVDHHSDLLEQRLLVDFVDRQAVRVVIEERQAGPSTGHNHTTPGRTRGLDQRVVQALRHAVAAKTEVDRWLARLNEPFQLTRKRTRIGQDPGAGLKYGLVRGIRPGRQYGVGREPGTVGKDVAADIRDRGQPH